MSHGKLDEVIARTTEKAHVWLNELQAKLGSQDERLAYHVLRAVLHAIRDRMHVEQVASLGAQLPLLIRGIYYEGWHPHGKPLHVHDAQAFLELVSAYLARDSEFLLNEQRVVSAVFQVLQAHLAPGEIDSVLNAMPTSIQQTFFGPS
jgi:uncharacterized protein (DUF2267 family)